MSPSRNIFRLTDSVLLENFNPHNPVSYPISQRKKTEKYNFESRRQRIPSYPYSYDECGKKKYSSIFPIIIQCLTLGVCVCTIIYNANSKGWNTMMVTNVDADLISKQYKTQINKIWLAILKLVLSLWNFSIYLIFLLKV